MPATQGPVRDRADVRTPRLEPTKPPQAWESPAPGIAFVAFLIVAIVIGMAIVLIARGGGDMTSRAVAPARAATGQPPLEPGRYALFRKHLAGQYTDFTAR